MKKRVFLASASVLLTLGLASFAVMQRGGYLQESADLALGASLDSGPVPVVAASYDLSAHQTLSRVILLIRENYVDPARIKPYDMFLAALNHIQKTVPEVMVDDTDAPRRVKVSVESAEQIFDLGGLDQLWEVTMALRDIFRFLQQHILDADERRDVEYAAINGMLSTLDPHSVLLKPESFDEVKLSTKGEFGGLGIVISIRDGALTIISPIEGTPASRSGLRARDQIVKIGEESTINMSLEEAVHRLRGKPGTKVIIWVKRKGWNESRKFTLTRAIIKIESVTSEFLDNGIGYVRIKSFQNNTYEDLRSNLDKLRKKNRGELKGLVLDLRNNPGGLLDQAIDVSDRFVDRGPIVVTVGEGNRKREVKQARFSGTESGYPIAVLVNGGSASASEIVSGALKNHDRAVIIGSQTFGKGSVQVLYDFKDRSALKLTIAQYLTPGDVSIQSVGINPDIEIVPSTVSADSLHLFAHREAPREKDLDMHLEQHGASDTPRQDEPDVRIVHVMPPEDDEQTEQKDPEAFEKDFEITLAHDLLVSSEGVTSAKQILARSRDLFASKAAGEEAKIAKSLTELGLDWTDGPKRGKPQAELKLRTSHGSGAKVGAGDEFVVTASVTNTGDSPLYRVYGVTESDNPLLGSLEFAFGRVEPGKTKSWDVKIKVPKDINARGDMMKIKLGDHHEATAGVEVEQYVTMRGVERPRFAYDVYIDDRAGNGDGMLQLGEAVSLKVDVRNLGPGKAKDVFVSTKNLSGESVFLDRGRHNVGEIKIGEAKTGDLHFKVREPTSEVKLRVTVWDNDLGAAVSEKLTLPVLSARRRQAENKGLKINPGGAPIYAGADSDASVIGQAKAGANVRSDASFDGSWRRLKLPGDRFGYLRDTDVVVARGNGRKASRDAIVVDAGHAPPSLSLTLGDLITTSDSMRITGKISDTSPLKDVFVFVNDRKVFYRSLDKLEAAAKTFNFPLDLNLPLKEGSNAVAVVVRENEDLITRRVFGVYREARPAVAERAPERGATQAQ